jgi:hypothetical protein
MLLEDARELQAREQAALVGVAAIVKLMANGVGTILLPTRVTNSSLKYILSRARVLLIKACVIFSFSAAADTLPSSIITSWATKRFSSSPLKRKRTLWYVVAH